ncbi:mycA, partial [Symbiodinium sp. CCMP2456]
MCGAGMSQPPAPPGDLQVVPSEELPLPVTLGRPTKAEDWREEASSHSRSTREYRQYRISGVFCMLLKAMLRIGTVVAISWLIMAFLENDWDERTVLMVGCSIIPGLAGMYLCSRASTKHSLSTAGFLLCTWILGLVQTDGVQDM